MKLPTRTEKAVISRLKNGLYKSALELMNSEFVCKEEESPYNWIGEFISAKATTEVVFNLIDTYPELATQVDHQNNCSLYYASHYHRLDVIKKLLSKGVDINKELNGYGNCINVAARLDDKKFLNALVTLGASPELVNARGDKAKVVAARWGNYENIDFFESIEKNPEMLVSLKRKGLGTEAEFNL